MLVPASCMCSLALAALPPAPPAMTPWQSQYMRGVAAMAKEASAAARPALLAALDDTEFRAALAGCCAGIAKLPAPRLLEWFRAQTDASEMVHNFDAAPSVDNFHHGDPPLSVYGDADATWFYNLWEVCPGVLNLTSGSCDSGPEDAGETGLFRMPEFANGRSPVSLAEAQQRPVYTAFNHRMVDACNQNFGDVCMVYAPDFVRPMTIVAPMDTGMWTMTCNSSHAFPPAAVCQTQRTQASCADDSAGCKWSQPTGLCLPWGCTNATSEGSCTPLKTPQGGCVWKDGQCELDGGQGHHHHHSFGGSMNCNVSDWSNATVDPATGRGGTFNLGTLEHYDHLILAGVGWWNQTIAQGLSPLFHRMYNSSSLKISTMEQFRYWEADIAGAVLYPQGIKMVIGVFPSLFGTDYGAQLQAWCRKQRWPLLWALGTNQPASGNGQHGMWDGNATYAMDSRATRVLDPTVFADYSGSHNTTLSPGAVADFQSLWAAVKASKSNNTTPGQYRGWFESLPREELRVRGLMAGECSDTSGCIGTRSDGHCVCSSPATAASHALSSSDLE